MKILFFLLMCLAGSIPPLSGQQIISLTAGSFNQYDPAWSATGDTLAFVSDQGGVQHICLLPLKSDAVEVFAAGPAQKIHPVWNFATNAIAFSSDSTSNQEIFSKLLAAGSQPVNLTNAPSSEESVSFNTDGSKMVFNSDRAGGNWDVYCQDNPTGQIVRLTQHPANDGEPVFSPDGSKIAFVSGRSGNQEIWVMNADGSNPLQLTNHPQLDIMPCWTPDGEAVTFASNRNGNFDLFTVALDDGATVAEIATPSNEVYPAWSPSGQYLAFTANYDGNDNIYLLMKPVQIPFNSQVIADGKLSPGEWTTSKSFSIYQSDRTIVFRAAHNGEALLLSVDLQNTTPGNQLRFPEVLFDCGNHKSTGWLADDWWFHVSATDCHYQGAWSNYANCLPEQPDWTGIPNFSTNPNDPLVDSIEIAIPLTMLDVSLTDTIGFALDATNTTDAWEFWPLKATIGQPSGWGTLFFGPVATGTPVLPGSKGALLFPNPAGSEFNIRLPHLDDPLVSVTMFDLRGRMVAREEVEAVESGLYRMQASELIPGFYFVQLRTNTHKEIVSKIFINL
jgi:TolB protein